MNPHKKISRAVVVGGGISGLAAAVKLVELSHSTQTPLEVVLVEAGQKLGGSISSLKKDGCLLEAGPDAIFTEKPWGLDFCRKLGLEDELIGTNPQFRTSFVAAQGKLVPVPEGFYLLAPSRILPLLATPLFSGWGKIRMLCDLLIPAKRSGSKDGIQDESLASFVRRRLGKEALERMAQPMVAGIYSADPEDLSLKATFPSFLDWEKKYGSVIRGLLIRRYSQPPQATRGPRYGLFVSLAGGLQGLVDRAFQRLPKDAVRLGTEIREVARHDSPRRKFRLVGNGFDMETDALCLAVPAFQSAKLLRPLDPELASELDQISYHSGITVNLIYKEEDVPYELDGFGFVVPRSEKRFISGCTFSSVKFPFRAPKSKVVLRAFAGGRSCGEWIARDHREIEQAVRKDLNDILGLSADPLHVFVHRHPDSLPQYRVGHVELVKRIENRLQAITGLTLAGNAYRGPGIPDCVHSGEQAAEAMFNSL